MKTHPDLAHPILVTGATGAVGRQLVAALLARGATVRALTRRPESAALPAEAAVFRGDLATGDVDPRALEGVRQVFVFPAEQGVAPFCKQLAAAGVEHAVVLSSLAAALEHERDRGSTSAEHHLAVERDVRAHSSQVTLLRPGTFANNLLAWARPIRAGLPIDLAFPTSAQAPIHEADVAAVAAAVLLDPTHRGRILPMTGPEALTRVVQLETIARAVGRTIEHREITAEEFSASMSRFMPPALVKMLLDYWADTVTTPDVVRSTQEFTGAPGRTLAQWSSDHARDFT